jgi:hypothetical protein
MRGAGLAPSISRDVTDTPTIVDEALKVKGGVIQVCQRNGTKSGRGVNVARAPPLACATCATACVIVSILEGWFSGRHAILPPKALIGSLDRLAQSQRVITMKSVSRRVSLLMS